MRRHRGSRVLDPEPVDAGGPSCPTRISSVPPDDSRALYLLTSLKRQPPFDMLEDAILTTLVASMRLMELAVGEFLVEDRQSGGVCYVVDRGELAIVSDREDVGSVLSSGTVRSGDIFGESEMIYDVPRIASLRAITEASVWALHHDVFQLTVKADRMRGRQETHAFVKLLGPLHEKLDMAMPNDGSPASNLRRFPEDLRVSPDAGGNANGLMSRGDSSRSGSHQRLEELPTGQLSPQYLLSPDASQHGGSLFSRGEASLHGGSMWVVGGTGGGSRENSQRGGSLFGGLGGVSPLVRAPPPPLDQLTFVTGLGAGGFGRVQLMRDTKTRRVYALKVINKYTVLHLLKSASLGSGRPPARLLCLLAPRCAPDGLGRLGSF